MFKKLQHYYILKQISKYENLPLFQTPIDVLHVQIGTYGDGLARDMDILLDQDTREKYELTEAKFHFNENRDLVLVGTRKDNGMMIEHIIKKEDISWHRTIHITGIGLDEDLDLCSNPNEGMFDLQLKNGESIILNYLLDKKREFDMIS